MITIIAIGKKTDEELINAIERYEKRLKAPFHIKWLLLPNSVKSATEAVLEESRQILSSIKLTDFVVLLDERGYLIDNQQFTSLLTNNSNVVMVIGGSYGVDDNVRRRADYILSVSKLVFPHQLMRLILAEQIYRSQCIYNNHPYHHK